MGTFGMPQLGQTGCYPSIPRVCENANISINTQERNGETVPVGIPFENASGDFKNDYLFMASEITQRKT